VNVTDAGGLQSVKLSYWPGNSGVLTVNMTHTSGSTWKATIVAQDSWSGSQYNEDPDGLISYWVEATDSSGNKATINHSNSYRLYKNDVCLL